MGGIMEYIYCDTKEQAHTLMIECLGRGIYCKMAYTLGMPGIEIDVERTCKEKNTVLIELGE
jgi:hypothetical protein